MRTSENGNVIFYIFIAIALLGALSFAVTQSFRSGGKNLSEDRAQLAATEVMAYGDAIAKSVAQLRLRGIPEYGISFAHPSANATYGTYDSTPRSEIFNPQGGGVLYRKAPDIAGSGAPLTYNFVGAYAIDGLGLTGCTLPTNAPAECSELLLVVQGLRLEVCQMINHLLGLGEKTDTPPAEASLPTTPLFVGNNSGTPNPYTYADTIGDDGGSAALSGQTAGCYYNAGSTSYVYYQVLITR